MTLYRSQKHRESWSWQACLEDRWGVLCRNWRKVTTLNPNLYTIHILGKFLIKSNFVMMAKLIPYQPDTERKLGFRKVRKDHAEDQEQQLDLFRHQRDIQKIRHLDPFEKGLQLDERNDDLAEKLYLEAIRNSISVADAFCNLGIIYAGRGGTAQAIDCFTNALIQDPRHTEAHYNLANMYYDAGNYQLALTHYEVAFRMEGSFAEITYNLALTHLCLHNRDKAVYFLRKYVEQAEPPDQVQAQKLISLLALQ